MICSSFILGQIQAITVVQRPCCMLHACEGMVLMRFVIQEKYFQSLQIHQEGLEEDRCCFWTMNDDEAATMTIVM